MSRYCVTKSKILSDDTKYLYFDRPATATRERELRRLEKRDQEISNVRHFHSMQSYLLCTPRVYHTLAILGFRTGADVTRLRTFADYDPMTFTPNVAPNDQSQGTFEIKAIQASVGISVWQSS